MATKRESILQAVMNALTGTTGVGTRIYRNRSEPLARNETPALMVTSELDTPEEHVLGIHTRELDFTLSVFVRGNSPESLADPVVESMHSKIMADTTLGGLALDLNAGPTKFDFIEADMPAGIVSSRYTITYRTQVNSLSA
tara:strand:+ start:15552 stop:15974 length:423 start_codon:yes stop_codon:yes gene_type:complete